MGRRQRESRVVYGVLTIQIIGVVAFAAAYNALDFHIYWEGGRVATNGAKLYREQLVAHWYTNTPFMASLFIPISHVPLAVARVLWESASVGAFSWAWRSALELGGFRCTRARLAAVVAAGLFLQPMWQSIFLGQVNPMLLAFVLADVRMLAAGRRRAGIGVGVAAALKLTPAIFVVVLLLAGRIRAAAVAAATFLGCGLLAFAIAPTASRVYWGGVFLDTSRVGAAYVSNQSPFGAAARLLGGPTHVGGWYPAVPLVLGAAGLAVATAWARREDWLAATAVTGTTGLLVSPISWAHHWVWVVPALVLLVRAGRRRWAAGVYVLFCLSPLWWMPRKYGFDGVNTLVANSYLLCGLAFIAYMAWQLHGRPAGTSALARGHGEQQHRLAGDRVLTDR
ncbi:glycosyltransferase 87 family protein [Actinacidiphila rubida]|uniref:glycosyltransferase 87 family protein n=2 Tax=Actinacidiphila rubida TaxID=310780 RepID=UPI0009A10D1E|nr:glycosyltransferase 87 family protein [Actinacidiphila rubida]